MIPENDISAVTNQLTDVMVEIIFDRVRVGHLVDRHMIDDDCHFDILNDLGQTEATINKMWNSLCD